jgi:hypothetical protein
MPLLDHFRPPLAIECPWDGFHAMWAATMATLLNLHHLPTDYFAIPQTKLGGGAETGGIATKTWAPAAPPLQATVDFADLDVFEVQIRQNLGGPQLRAAIELVSPANKDRESHRHAFAVKCAAYLQRDISVIIFDAVTERRANLHSDIMDALGLSSQLPWHSPTNLSTIAYRIAHSPGLQQLEVWPEALTIGALLPTLPLWIDADLCLPLALEESYVATCAALRIRS